MIVPRTTKASSSADASITGWPSLPALTTVFTPPASCSNLPFTYTDSGFWRDAGLLYTECYPPGFMPAPNDNEYSPGVCPASYTPNIITEGTYANGAIETYAYCCPFTMALMTYTTVTASTSLGTYTTFQCEEVITTPTWYINGSRTLSTSGVFTGLASGLWAEWEAKDLSLFTPISAPVLGYAHLAGERGTHSTKSSTSSAGSVTMSPKASSGLSDGAKAGIGAGVGVLLLCLLGVAMWWVRRYMYRRRQDLPRKVSPNRLAELDRAAERLEAPGFDDIKEIDTIGQRYEAAGPDLKFEKNSNHEPVELEGGWHGHEVADNDGDCKDEKRLSRSSSILETPAHLFYSRKFWS